MTGLDERQAFAKLEALKDIRNKTINLEKTRVGLLCDVAQCEDEERCLQEYESELQALNQEKMAHVEVLRQIHADINNLEGIIKQAKDSRSAAQENARKLLQEYVPLKQDVNRLRTDILDLAKLPEISDEEKERLKAAGVLDKDKSLSEPWVLPPRDTDIKSSVSLSLPPPQTNHPFLSMAGQHSPIFGNLGLSKPQFPSHGSIAPLPNPPPFRYQQQPPPMKSCLSCHQQIHRNAPICPLCKAKSRSRNPKKPKKKD